MKSLINGILTTLFLTQICFAQWFWQNPIPGNTYGINKIKFFDPENGFVICTGGIIYMTTNGGDTWGPVYTGEQGNLIDLGFSNSTGIIISEKSILKTTDKGYTWDKLLEIQGDTVFQYCSLVDSLNYFVAAKIYGTVSRTFIFISNDGGITWHRSPIIYGNPYELCFINKSVGLCFAGNKLYRTTDGGMSWISIQQFPSVYTHSISFCNSLQGIMINNNYGYNTTDGGLSWNQVNSPDFIDDVIYYDPDLIIAVGSHKSVYKSTDQGNTWIQLLRLSSGSSDVFTSISVIDNFFYVSGPGDIYKSSDSGENWFSIKQGTMEHLFSVNMVNRNFGITVGNKGTILTTHNGGATWQSKNSGVNEYLSAVDCIDTLTALAVGWNGTIIKTTDAGENWESENSGVSVQLHDVTMLNQNTGLVVGGAGTLLKTTDGGNTWQPQGISYMALWVVSYMDSSNIFIGATLTTDYGAILRSQDSGITWDTVYQILYKTPHSIDCLGTQTIVVSGSANFVVKSTDMGSNWILLNPPQSYYDYNCYTSFIDSLNGLFCYDEGYISRTTNGGNTWISEWPNWSQLTDIQMLNNNDAIAVGYYGTIISSIADHEIPVELLSFNGYSESGKVHLDWSTASELNNLMFEVERKIITDKDEGNWVRIGFRNGQGTTTEITRYNYVDDINNINASTVKYRLKQIDYSGKFSYSKIIDINASCAYYRLFANYPNPFNPATKIKYTIPEDEFVQLKVYDILGGEIKTLVNQEKRAGSYEVEFAAANLPSGVYFYQIKAGNFIQTKKMILLK